MLNSETNNANNANNANIPIINISNPSPEVAQQVLDADSTHGFLFIQNDGSILPIQHVNNMFDLVGKPSLPSVPPLL